MSTINTLEMLTINALKNGLSKSILPSRTFFRVSERIDSLQQARAIIKTIGTYGDMVEYKFMRCPETLEYLQYGFVVFKEREDADKAITEQFLTVQSEVFDKSVNIKIEKSKSNDTYRNDRYENDRHENDRHEKDDACNYYKSEMEDIYRYRNKNFNTYTNYRTEDSNTLNKHRTENNSTYKNYRNENNNRNQTWRNKNSNTFKKYGNENSNIFKNYGNENN